MSDETPLAPPTRTEHYRRTLVPMQLFVLVLCGVTYITAKPDWLTILILFVSLEVFGCIGAVWAASLARRMTAKQDRLPLENRRR
jgi:hypothetical protein